MLCSVPPRVLGGRTLGYGPSDNSEKEEPHRVSHLDLGYYNIPRVYPSENGVGG